nr:MAG TPA: major capsid protein [Caudoviricetes sp.]
MLTSRVTAMRISRKEREKFKMAINFDYDFSGWATKANVKCFDGLTIAPNAFKDCDGKVVPVVWNHDHSAPESVLGHALLQNRKEGVYAYVKLNDTSSGQTAKACVDNGDIDAMSIYANGIQKAGRTVMHGMIKELSLVIAGCNPGALIDEVVKHSADGTETDSSEAYIYTDSGLSLKHGLDPDDNPLEDETLQHSDDSSETDKEKKGESKMADANEKTVKEVFDTLTEEQKNVVYAIIGSALDEGKGGESDDKGDGEEENTMHHCFENDNGGTVLKHSLDDINGIIATASKHGTLRDAFLDAGITGDELAHSIENMDYLFPDDHNLDTVPRIVDRDQTWVDKVMNGVHHVPFARVKVMFADLTEDEARAKGYIKGNYKKEQVFKLLKRSTTPTTVYKKQRFDRDDIVDMSTMDVVGFVKKEQRGKLNEELGMAFLIGDGRDDASDDKINELNIRPIFNDDDFYTIKVVVQPGTNANEDAKAKATIKSIIKARKEYKGSGSPTFYTTDDVLTDMLLLEDGIGHPLYADEAALARKLRVKEIVTVPRMEGRKGAKGGDLLGIVVNLADYTVGADKGGEVNMFDDFNIDYNQLIYLIETRCSGAMTTPYGAMAIEMDAANSSKV